MLHSTITRSAVHVEWHLVEDREWWEAPGPWQPQAVSTGSGAGRVDRWFLRLLLRSVALCGALLIMVAGTGTTQSDEDRIAAHSGIRNALALEARAVLQADKALAASLIDTTIDLRWQREWRDQLALGFQGDVGEEPRLLNVTPLGALVSAQVRVDRPVFSWRQVNPYLETRFYREVGGVWMRTLPSPAFWGPRTLLESDNLVFEFHAADGAHLEPLIDDLETRYRAMHELLGTPLPPPTAKLRVVISPELVSGSGIYPDRLKIVSPILSSLPEGMDQRDYLTYTIVRGMVYHTVERRNFLEADGTTSSAQWRNLNRGLRYWMTEHFAGILWPWEAEADSRFRLMAPARMPLSLGDINRTADNSVRDLNFYLWRNGASKSIVAYIVHTYGTESLPDLIVGMRRYRSRGDVVSHVFPQSTAEFETGWNDFLIEYYGVSATADRK